MSSDNKIENEETIPELQGLVRDFINDRDWDKFHSAKDLAIGLATEASEFLELFRFRSELEIRQRMHEDANFREMLSDELADAFYFILRFSDKFKLNLSQCLRRKLAKTALKYPLEKSRGSNKKYTELG